MSGHQIQLFLDRSGAGINWRLLAANNRETARGVRLHPGAETCRAEVRALQTAADRFTARTRRLAPGRWTWEVSLDGTVVAASTHTFDRQIRCEQVLATVVQRFRSAVIADVVIDTTGRRRESHRSIVRTTTSTGEYV